MSAPDAAANLAKEGGERLESDHVLARRALGEERLEREKDEVLDGREQQPADEDEERALPRARAVGTATAQGIRAATARSDRVGTWQHRHS
eukprot:5955759-Prymnesium_polylepis.1